jgi:hypothetical protein
MVCHCPDQQPACLTPISSFRGLAFHQQKSFSMELTLTIAAAALVTVASSAAAMTPLQRETAVWNAVKAKRMAEFKASMPANFVGMYSWGIHDRAAELRVVHNQTLRSFALANFRSVMVDPDNMLVTYIADVKGTENKEDFSGHYWNTSLWHRAGGRWLTVYHSEAKVK